MVCTWPPRPSYPAREFITTRESPRISRFTHPVAVLVCLEQPIAEGEVALPEEIEHVHLAVAGMPLQGLQDRGGGQPLVHEQGQGRHVEGEPLGFPAQSRAGEREGS